MSLQISHQRPEMTAHEKPKATIMSAIDASASKNVSKSGICVLLHAGQPGRDARFCGRERPFDAFIQIVVTKLWISGVVVHNPVVLSGLTVFGRNVFFEKIDVKRFFAELVEILLPSRGGASPCGISVLHASSQFRKVFLDSAVQVIRPANVDLSVFLAADAIDDALMCDRPPHRSSLLPHRRPQARSV